MKSVFNMVFAILPYVLYIALKSSKDCVSP